MDYTSQRWLRLRERVLRRDGYMCREARRYGKRVSAVVVHHVYPAEEWPEYAWCDWNLISLSRENHNRMHDRETGRLTAAGLRWMERITPPIPGPTDGLKS
jgi:5-methylcytosine-specific restriction protein A